MIDEKKKKKKQQFAQTSPFPILLVRLPIAIFLLDAFETLASSQLVGTSQYEPPGGVVLHISPPPLLSADDYKKMTSASRQD